MLALSLTATSLNTEYGLIIQQVQVKLTGFISLFSVIPILVCLGRGHLCFCCCFWDCVFHSFHYQTVSAARSPSCSDNLEQTSMA